jgi:hypothetical protein
MCRYPKIQRMELKILCDNYDSPAVLKGMKKKLRGFLNGEYPHAVDAFGAFFEVLRPDDSLSMSLK